MSHVLQGRGQAGVGAGAGRAAGPGAATQPGELEGNLEDAWKERAGTLGNTFFSHSKPRKSAGEARGKLGGSWGKHATFWGSTPLGVSNSLEKKGKQLVRAAFLYISVIKVYSVLKDLGVCSGHLQTRPKGV